MAHLGKARRRRRADALRQAVERTQLRKPRLDRGVALPQPVVLGVGDGRRVFLIVAAVVRGDLFGKPRVLGLRLLFGERLDRKLRVSLDAMMFVVAGRARAERGDLVSVLRHSGAGRRPEPESITTGRRPSDASYFLPRSVATAPTSRQTEVMIPGSPLRGAPE